jgi:hypothetical protein
VEVTGIVAVVLLFRVDHEVAAPADELENELHRGVLAVGSKGDRPECGHCLEGAREDHDAGPRLPVLEFLELVVELFGTHLDQLRVVDERDRQHLDRRFASLLQARAEIGDGVARPVLGSDPRAPEALASGQNRDREVPEAVLVGQQSGHRLPEPPYPQPGQRGQLIGLDKALLALQAFQAALIVHLPVRPQVVAQFVDGVAFGLGADRPAPL